jgi:hypothetical protein
MPSSQLVEAASNQAQQEANRKKRGSGATPQPMTDTDTIRGILKRFGGDNEALNQLPGLEGQLKESVETQAQGKRPEQEFMGGQTHGNLAAGLASAIRKISDKIQSHPDLNSTIALEENKKYLLNDPEVRALVEHPRFKQMYPDFWHRMATYNNIRD